MEQQMYRILYCSRNLIDEGGDRSNQAIGQILEKARTNNRRRNVTGALLYNAGYFAQVLEGPKVAIEQVFERIQQDPRHGEVTVIDCSAIDLRDFPEWSMARVQTVSESQAAIAVDAVHSALQNPEAADGVLELLRSLVINDD